MGQRGDFYATTQADIEERAEQVLLNVGAMREERDQLAREAAELRDERDALRDERDGLLAQHEPLFNEITRLQDVITGIASRLGEQVSEELPVERAAERLVRLLDRALGFEQLDDTPELHDIFRELDAVKDALCCHGPEERSNWVYNAARAEKYEEELECRRRKPRDRA